MEECKWNFKFLGYYFRLTKEDKFIILGKKEEQWIEKVNKNVRWMNINTYRSNCNMHPVIGSEITRPYYIEVKIVTAGVTPYNTNLEIIKEFEAHGFEFMGEPITQTNDEVAWTFMMKNNGLLQG